MSEPFPSGGKRLRFFQPHTRVIKDARGYCTQEQKYSGKSVVVKIETPCYRPFESRAVKEWIETIDIREPYLNESPQEIWSRELIRRSI